MQVPLTVLNCVIHDNQAAWGGGIECFFGGGPVLVSDSQIANNHATSGGGGIEAEGDITIVRSTISGNTTEGEGGGLRHIMVR